MFLLFSFSFEKSIVKSSNRKTNDMISWIFLPNINEWQKFETIGGVEASIEKAQILTDYIMSIHWSSFVLLLIFFNNYWF